MGEKCLEHLELGRAGETRKADGAEKQLWGHGALAHMVRGTGSH